MTSAGAFFFNLRQNASHYVELVEANVGGGESSNGGDTTVPPDVESGMTKVVKKKNLY